MAEGGFEYHEMEDLGRKYPKYDNMTDEQLNIENENLRQGRLDSLLTDDDDSSDDIKKGSDYIDRIRENRNKETSLIDNKDDETVIIKTEDGNSDTAHELQFPEVPQDRNFKTDDIEDFINREYKIKNFKFNLSNDSTYDFLIKCIKITDQGNIKFKSEKKYGVGYLKEQVVLKRDTNQVLQYNNDVKSDEIKEVVRQFKISIEKIIKDQKGRENSVRKNPMVDTESNELEWKDEFGNINPDVIPGLTPKEIKVVRGVFFPSESMEAKKRIGPNGMLPIQMDPISKIIGYTERELDWTSNPELRRALEERIYGLNEARELTSRQKILEETRFEQEEDITRLQGFKEWAKENFLGLSALAISIVGIITTIVVGARKALIKGAQATGKLAKALYNLGRKLGPLLAPLLNIIAQAITWGAKGLAWLSKNLWLLALAVAWFIYDQYKERRREN